MLTMPDYIAEFQKLIPFRIRLKSDSRTHRLLALAISWYIPTYLTHYVTIIGRTIYLPKKHALDHSSSIFMIAHEVVHLMDQRRLSYPVFILMYLSPQILTLGIFTFPWIGWWACCFLIFVLPWPSVGRVYLESRAYGLEQYLIQKSMQGHSINRVKSIFTSWDYYKM